MSDPENIGPLDRVNRMIVALTLIAVAVVFTAISPAATFSLVVVSIYAGLTAAIGWDPMFAVIKVFSQQAPNQTSATLEQPPPSEEQAAVSTYKKAA